MYLFRLLFGRYLFLCFVSSFVLSPCMSLCVSFVFALFRCVFLYFVMSLFSLFVMCVLSFVMYFVRSLVLSLSLLCYVLFSCFGMSVFLSVCIYSVRSLFRSFVMSFVRYVVMQFPPGSFCMYLFTY